MIDPCRGPRALFVAVLVVGVVTTREPRAQDRSGPRTEADRELVEAERLYQEGVRLRGEGDADESSRAFERAEEALRTVLRHDPGRVAAVARLSLILYAQERSRDAVPLLEAALRRAPAEVQLKHQLGLHLFAVHREREGQALLEEVTRSNDDLYDAHLMLARHAYRGHDYDQAIDRFERYLRARPDALSRGDAEIFGNIGNAHLAAERFAPARAAYQKVLARSDRNLPARINIAYSYYQEGNYREAANRYEALLRLGNPPPVVLANLARAQWKLGQVPAALERCRQLERLHPTSHLGWLVEAEVLLDRRNVRGAVGKIREALTRAPRDVPTLVVAGKVFLSSGDRASAERHLQTARRLAPEDFEVSVAFALFLRSVQREREALPLYERTTTLRPRRADLWYGLGACQYALGNADAALQAFQTALEKDPAYVLAKSGVAALHNRRAVTLLGSNDVAGAKVALAQALAVDPESRLAHRNLGAILLGEGDAATALPHLERCAATDRDGLFLLGRALLAAGRPADAVTKLQAAARGQGRVAAAELDQALGAALSLQGQHDQAITALKRSAGNRPSGEPARLVAMGLFRRALARIAAQEGRAALQDLDDAEGLGRDLSREQKDRIAFAIGLAHLGAGDGRRALGKLQPLARSRPTFLVAPYDAVGVDYFSMFARYLANDYRAFFTSLRTVRGRAPAELGASLDELEVNARLRNAEALFTRGQFAPAAAELASVRGRGAAATGGLYRLAEACLKYARGQRDEAGQVFAELARRARGGSDEPVPREAVLDHAVFLDEVRHDHAASAEAYRQYVTLGGRHAAVARRILESKRRVLGIGEQGGGQ